MKFAVNVLSVCHTLGAGYLAYHYDLWPSLLLCYFVVISYRLSDRGSQR